MYAQTGLYLRMYCNILQQGISEPIFYGDLLYKFKRIVGKSNFSDQFKKIVKLYSRANESSKVASLSTFRCPLC